MDMIQVQEELKTFKKKVDAAARLFNDISRLDKERESNLLKLRGLLARLEKTLADADQESPVFAHARGWLEGYRQELASTQEKMARHFGADLDRLLKEQGLTLLGQSPELKAGLFTVELDFDRLQAKMWYGPREEAAGQARLTAVDVAAGLEKVRSRLGSGLEPEQFMSRLQQAYQRAAGPRSAEPAPIIEVLNEMAHLLQSQTYSIDPRQEHYTGYSRADFSYDLFQFRRLASEQFKRKLSLAVATRAHTRQRRDFLWVPDDESGRGTRYSHLQLKEIAS